MSNKFWANQLDLDGNVHFVPLGDTKAHTYRGCICKPSQTEDVVLHKAFDGRALVVLPAKRIKARPLSSQA